ncbi:MAG: hypothetical protein GQ582_05960, partial [Methyloprofundus sp.]|nr:hypothetical protein [Methyloprofundus sp.]
MPDSQPHCYLFTALPCEAKPLIAYFKLKKELSVTAFTVYRNAGITLTVTGLGKAAMAAGVAYTFALYPSVRLAVVLNIGVAGHKDFELGTAFVAEKISDKGTGRHYYPQLLTTPPWATHPVTTVSRAELNYAADCLYEMEASAFYETAARFSSSELIHSIKLISDNQQNPSTQVTAVQISAWINDALPMLDQYRQQLIQIASEIPLIEVCYYAEISEQWRFSSQEKRQLKSLLSK